MVQATVAAHISAVCTTALRHREEIIATTITPTSMLDAEGLTPTSSFTESMSSADTTVDGDGAGHAGGEALERGGVVGGPHAGSCGGGDSSADSCDHNGVGGGDVEPAGREHQMKKCIAEQKRSPDTKGANQLEEREANKPQLTEGGDGEEAAAVDAAAVGSTEASSSPHTLVETDAADHAASAEDDDADDDWWEEDEEDREGKDGCEKNSGQTETVASATHGAWWGTAGKGEKSQGGGGRGRGGARGGGGAGRGVGSGTSRWMRRREREAPFLCLLVRSQVC